MNLIDLLFAIVSIGGVGTSVYLFVSYKTETEKKRGYSYSKEQAEELAEKLANKKIEVAEEKKKELQSIVDSALSENRRQLAERKKELKENQEIIDNREKLIAERENALNKKKKNIENISKESDEIANKLKTLLAQISSISEEEIEKKIKDSLKKDISEYIQKNLNYYGSVLQIDSEKVSENIIEDILPGSASDFTGDSTSPHIDIPSEKALENFIGKNEENLKALEKLTKGEIDINSKSRDGKRREIAVETLDPIRREVASRVILKALQTKSSINPKWIEQEVLREKKVLLKDVKQTGIYACKEVGLTDLPEKLVISVGKCKYRFSYGQNLLKHNIEMAKLGESLALILGADVHISKVACFLHDIGKVEPNEPTPHHHISAELTKELYSDSDVLYNAIIAHHFDIDAEYIESHIVRIADSISGARPGARRNSAEEYFEKVRALDEIANTYEGVKNVQIMNGAREIRVMVNPNQVDDKASDKLAGSIAGNIEEQLNYPGSIKVQVIRTNQATAKANAGE